MEETSWCWCRFLFFFTARHFSPSWAATGNLSSTPVFHLFLLVPLEVGNYSLSKTFSTCHVFGGRRLCRKVSDILLCKSEKALCWEGSRRRLSQQSNGYGRVPLKTNSVSKTVKILSYKNLFQHQGSHWDGNSNVHHFGANLEKMSVLYLRDNYVFF